MPARILKDDEGAVYGFYREADDKLSLKIDEEHWLTMYADGTTRVSHG